MSILMINDEDHAPVQMYLRTCRRYRITTSLTYSSHQFNPLAFVLLFLDATGGLEQHQIWGALGGLLVGVPLGPLSQLRHGIGDSKASLDLSQPGCAKRGVVSDEVSKCPNPLDSRLLALSRSPRPPTQQGLNRNNRDCVHRSGHPLSH